MSKRLRLLAETGEDLTIISAGLQDAIVRVGDIYFDRKGQSLVIITNRYSHETQAPGRLKSGLGLHNILSVKMKGIDRSDPDAFLVLLSIEFVAASNPPGGEVRLVFAGGGEISADTECLEVRLIDIQAARTTKSIPLHPTHE